MKAAARRRPPEPVIETAQIIERRRTWDDVIAELKEQERIADEIARKKRFRASWECMIRKIMAEAEGRVTVTHIINETSFKYGISVDEIKGHSRVVSVIQAKHEVCWRSVKQNGHSLPHTGRVMNGKDHTTILSGVRKYARLQRIKAGLEPPRKYDRLIDFSKIIDLEDEA